MIVLPKLPPVLSIGTILSGILGRPVTVTRSGGLDLTPKTPKVFGIYRKPGGGRTCVCALDLPFAANAAGAMLIFPPYAVASAVRAGKLDDDLLETTREILNICSRFFHDEVHVVLTDVCTDMATLPADAVQVLKTPQARVDVQAAIKGYADGRLTLLFGKPEDAPR